VATLTPSAPATVAESPVVATPEVISASAPAPEAPASDRSDSLWVTLATGGIIVVVAVILGVRSVRRKRK
jgi:hypothetical protein